MKGGQQNVASSFFLDLELNSALGNFFMGCFSFKMQCFSFLERKSMLGRETKRAREVETLGCSLLRYIYIYIYIYI